MVADQAEEDALQIEMLNMFEAEQIVRNDEMSSISSEPSSNAEQNVPDVQQDDELLSDRADQTGQMFRNSEFSFGSNNEALPVV